MKLIDVPSLTDINVMFNTIACNGVALQLRVELYSCKATAATRSLARSFDDEIQLRPSSSLDEDTALALNRKTLLYLLDTLNEALPDYDFSHTKVDQFNLLPSAAHVQAQINAHLASCVPNYTAAYADQLWLTITTELDTLDDVEIYTYVGDDPFAAADADRSDDDDERIVDEASIDDEFGAEAGAGGGGLAVGSFGNDLLLSSSPMSGGGIGVSTNRRSRRKRRGTVPPLPLWSFNYFFFDRKRKRVMLWYAFVRPLESETNVAKNDNVQWTMD
jgi:hypothetical protein